MVLTPGENPADETTARLLALRGRGAPDDEALGRLLLDEAVPLLESIVRRRLADLPRAEQEEVESGALLRLTEMLQRFVAGDPEVEIQSFRAYVGTTGSNACRAFLRRRHPERTRLSNQLRYALGHDPGLALWSAADGSVRTGLAGWRGRDDEAFAAIDAAARPAPFEPGPSPSTGAALPALLRRFFLHAGRPVRFDRLLAAMAEALGVHDRPLVSLSEAPASVDDDEGEREIAETRPGAQRQLEDRQYLEALWAEVALLPLRQRTALLLNLRDDQGRDRLRLLPATGVVDLPTLAASLALEIEELRQLLPELPLEDRLIAERLDATPRQVINLRKSARARLARRLSRGA
ncbi:MAG: hypothetical protein AB7G12_16255 [Thermoanaerobaculia bacterium]